MQLTHWSNPGSQVEGVAPAVVVEVEVARRRYDIALMIM